MQMRKPAIDHQAYDLRHNFKTVGPLTGVVVINVNKLVTGAALMQDAGGG